MDKYYTPEIEEFHIGFEYESLGLKTFENVLPNRWIKKKVITGVGITNVSADLHVEGLIRVKYLDHDDIFDTFGDIGGIFYRVGRQGVPTGGHEGWTEYLFNTRERSLGMIFANANLNIVIEEYNFGGRTGCNATVFNGICKNKSEFKRILKQIGVEK